MATLSKHLNAFKGEALMMLRFQFAFNRISKFEDIRTISRSDFVDKLITLKTIENDLVMRICKFNDNTKGTHSFKKAFFEINKEHKNYLEIKKLLKTFENNISEIQKVRRHTKLAHLKINFIDEEYDLKYEFTGILRLIILIIDLFNGEKVQYKWSDGRFEKFNLRIEVLKEE